MKTKFTIIYVCALLFSFSALAQGTVSGKVTSGSEAVIGATVVLYNSTGGIVKGSVTDSEGLYEIKGVDPKEYILEIKGIGYAGISQKVSIADGGNVLDFTMEESVSTLDAVIVSAGRRAQKRTESSANIQLVDARTIEVAQEPTAYGLLKNVSGLNYVETGLGQQQVNSRGFASIFTGGVLTLVDYRNVTLPGIGGVFGPTMGVNQNDIKQIEVIVGPNSALYGANASNGVINIITKNPKEYAGHEIMVKGGTRSQLGFSARSSGMLGDKFGYKLSGEYFTADDFDQTVNLTGVSSAITRTDLSNTPTNPDNTIKNTTVSGGLYFFPTDNTEISYTGGLAVANYVNQSNIGPLQVKDFTFWYHQLRANFSNFLGGSAFFQANFTEDDAKNTYNLELVTRLTADGVPEADAIETATFIDTPTRLTAEFQHNFDLAEDNIVTWGVQYTDTKPNSGGTFLSDGPNGEQIEIKEFGAYLQYENEMIKDVNVTLSGRFDDNDNFGSQFSPKFSIAYTPGTHNFRVAWNQAFASPPLQPAFALTPITTLQLPSEINPALPPGLVSTPVDMVLRGAKDTGFTILDANGNSVATINALSPTITKSWEIGYKGLIADKFFIDFTYFNTTSIDFLSAPIPINNPELIFNATPLGVLGLDFIPTGTGWGDLAFPNPDPNADPNPITYVEGFGNELVLSYINYGEVKSQGINVNFEYQFNNNFSANASYQWISFDEFTDVPATVTSTPSLNSPENTARIGFKYSNKNGLYIDMTGRWIEAHEVVAARQYTSGDVPSYIVVDLKGEMPIQAVKGLNFGIAINNLLNEKYRALPGTPELGFLGTAYLRFEFGK